MSDARGRACRWLNRSGMVWLGIAVLAAAGLAGCTSEKSRLEAIAATATAGTGRAAAASALRQAFFAKEITANGAIDLAHERVNPTGPRASTAADVAFAAAVLDFLEQVEPDLNPKVINDFFWIRVGSLAGNAAAAAQKAGDTATARSVVLAGPKHWQGEVYWRQCPAHDALASLILFQSGEGDEALKRLRDRPELPEEVQAAKDMIEKEMKRRPKK